MPIQAGKKLNIETISMSKIIEENKKVFIPFYQMLSEKIFSIEEENVYLATTNALNEVESKYKESIISFCKLYKNDEDFRKKGFGFYITGVEGTGKSRYSACIYNELKNDFIVYRTSLLLLLDEIVQNFGEKTVVGFLTERLEQVDIIILEDVGNEHLNDWTRQNVYFIFDFISRKNKSLIMNTNQTDNQIKEFFRIFGSDKILSRIKNKTKYLKFNWEDRRSGQHKKEIDSLY